MTLKLKIIKNGQQTHGADSSQFESLAEFESWKQQCIDGNVWGKPERWVKDSPLEPLTEEQKLQAVEVRDVDDGMGNIEKEYKFLAEYEVVIEDITLQVNQNKINQEALAYLASTDWMVLREMDGGMPMPTDIKLARAEARAKIIK